MIRNRPVIVVHLDTAEGAGLTACSGDEFEPDQHDMYKDIPRVLCHSCQHAAMTGHAYHVPGDSVIVIANGQVTISRRQPASAFTPHREPR